MDQNVQEKVLSQVSEGDSLKKTLAYINTLEKARRDTITLAAPGGLNRQGNLPIKSGRGKDLSKITCYNCGNLGHRCNNRSCPAKGKECYTCGRVDHFANAPACPRRRVTSHTTRKLSEEDNSSGMGDSVRGTDTEGSQTVGSISTPPVGRSWWSRPAGGWF